MKTFIEFLTSVDSNFSSLLTDKNFAYQHAISNNGGNWEAVFFSSQTNAIKIYCDDRNGDARIEIGDLDAPYIQEDSINGVKVWHDISDLASLDLENITLEEALAALPKRIRSTEEILIDQREFLLEHYDEIMNTFNKLKNL